MNKCKLLYNIFFFSLSRPSSKVLQIWLRRNLAMWATGVGLEPGGPSRTSRSEPDTSAKWLFSREEEATDTRPGTGLQKWPGSRGENPQCGLECREFPFCEHRWEQPSRNVVARCKTAQGEARTRREANSSIITRHWPSYRLRSFVQPWILSEHAQSQHRRTW